jgi:hypothetical protein
LKCVVASANEVKVVAFLTALKKLDEGAKQCCDREALTMLSIMSLYGSDGVKIASVDSHAIKAAESRVP